MKITLSQYKTVVEKVEVEVKETAIVPGWISDSKCPVCLWGLHEAKYSQYIMAAKLSNGDVVYFHPECLNRKQSAK